LQEEQEHKPDPWRNPIERNHMGLRLENEVYCVWQVVNILTIILNNPVYLGNKEIYCRLDMLLYFPQNAFYFTILLFSVQNLLTFF